MASKLDELMALATVYAVGVYDWSTYPSVEGHVKIGEARTALQSALKAVVEDAERFKSMHRWDGLPHAATDAVWIEPGRKP